MLIFSRKTGERITIGDDIKITVTQINRNQVRIGIDAPKSIPVHREEIKQKIDRESSDRDFRIGSSPSIDGMINIWRQ